MKTIILSFNFSKFSDETSPKFTSFTEKLQLYANIFQQKYDLAKQRFPDARIILVSHEYAITRIDDTNSQVLDYDEHLLLQESLKEFTLLNPNSVVIFPYAFSKEYHDEDVLPKLEKIAQRFQDDSHIKKPYTIEEDNLITYSANSSEDKIIVVRNVCYLFSEGIILNKVDKRIPAFEYTLLNSSIVRAPFVQGSTFFQPGTNRNIIQFNETQSLAIEICADHAGGLLKSTGKRNRLLVDYHLILSNSTPLKTEHLIGKFNILCDAMTGTSMMQLEEVNKKDVPLVIAITPECHSGLLEYNIEHINPEIRITNPSTKPAVELSDEILHEKAVKIQTAFKDYMAWIKKSNSELELPSDMESKTDSEASSKKST